MQLHAYAYEFPTSTLRSRAAADFREDANLLVLDTCQRFEVYAATTPTPYRPYLHRSWTPAEAFERLARIAAGLESRILGELEILGQVRAAYKHLKATEHAVGAPSSLDQTLQQALALGRRARKLSRIDRNLTSISGLAARTLLTHVRPDASIAVIGSGSIAGSTARYLAKRGSQPLRITSRCPDKAVQLALECGGFATGLDDLCSLLDGVGGVISATAAPHPVLYPRHMRTVSPGTVVVDLGEPPDCEQTLRQSPDIRYFGLLDIEQSAQVNTGLRQEAARRAEQIIRDGAAAWTRAN